MSKSTIAEAILFVAKLMIEFRLTEEEVNSVELVDQPLEVPAA